MYNNYTDIIVEWIIEFLISNTYVKLMVTAVLEINVWLEDSREPLATASAHSSFSMWGLSRPGLQAVGLALAHMMRSVQLDMYDCVKRLT